VRFVTLANGLKEFPSMLYSRLKSVNEPPVAALSNAKLRLTSVNPVVVRPPNLKKPTPLAAGLRVSAVFVVMGVTAFTAVPVPAGNMKTPTTAPILVGCRPGESEVKLPSSKS
jgi:hypothetical protein